jgi:type I site-specific restriction endonuclease
VNLIAQFIYFIDIDKRGLSERDICTKFITPAVRRAGWDVMSQIREEVSFKRRAAGETLASIAKSYGVHLAMISRL